MGAAPWSMTRGSVGEAEENLLRIAVVKLDQNVVGQEDAVDIPEPLPMMTAGRVEVLVIGLEEAEVHPVGITARGRAGPEEDPILILDQEPPRRVRLPAQLGDP